MSEKYEFVQVIKCVNNVNYSVAFASLKFFVGFMFIIKNLSENDTMKKKVLNPKRY